MLSSNISPSICYQRVLIHISIDKTTIADHDYQVPSLHCQYRDGFVTSMICIQNKASTMLLFSMYIIDVTKSSLYWQCSGSTQSWWSAIVVLS